MTGTTVDVTIVIVNYNTRRLLRPCLDAVQTAKGPLRLQIIVIDNGSRDDSAAYLQAQCADCEIVVNDTNVGFGRANNQAMARARGRYVLLLNTDAFVASDSLGRTVGFMDAHPSCSVLGVRLVGRDGILQPSCRNFPTPWNEFLVRCGLTRFFPGTRLVDDMGWRHDEARRCDWVPGCFYLVRKTMIDTVGLFDPRYFLYYEEVDHCRAVEAAGGEVVFFPGTTVVHIGGESAKSDGALTRAGRQISSLQIESSLLYFRKHHGLPGVMAAAVLATIGDVFLAAKSLLRRKARDGSVWRLSRDTWALLVKTDFGAHATR